MLDSLRNLLVIYNKGYIAERPTRSDFENFLSNLVQYQNEIKIAYTQGESEEHIKGIFKTFLDKCLCLETHSHITVNTSNNIDLVICKNNIPEVLFEFKRPKNPEMINTADMNKKALHEAIAYFYDQKISGNLNIKHIIITDGMQFFFFDARKFGHKKLEKLCTDFYNGTLFIDTMPSLYDAIKSLIDTNPDIDFYQHYHTFDISHFGDWATEHNHSIDYDDTDTFRMIQLYKVFHADFLLWEYNPVDSNQLNKKFYKELLYILGLQEKNIKGTITITPTNQDGGFMTEVLYKIKSESSLASDAYMDSAFGLITTWLNRILFLKLFEGQLVAFNDNDVHMKFMQSDKIPNFDTLNTLFFEILGTPIEQRREKYHHMHTIPYLNSALFERTSIEEKTGIVISNIPDNSEMKILSNSVLRNRTEYSVTKPQKTLKYLLDFLDAYDFASSYTTGGVKEDTPEIINSSVLGLIFEKLNGYKDGSYYTPGHITEYMAEQSINRAVVQKYNDAFGWNCQNILEIKNHMQGVATFPEYQKYTKIIDSLTVCDPAVGSGHFLVSVLNHIIALKSYFGLLWDGKEKIHDTVSVFNDILHIYYQNDKPFVYNRYQSTTHQLQQVIFAEKKRIIENSLFAVDINPNSVEICKLRLWIELLKHTYYYPNGTMEILPNIDINVKCGNSLISKFPPKVGQSILGKTPTKDQKQQIIIFRDLVHAYINAYGKQAKAQVQQQLDMVKKNIKNMITDQLDTYKIAPKFIKAIKTQEKKAKQAKTVDDIKQQYEKLDNLRAQYSKHQSGGMLGEVAEDPLYKNGLEWMLEFPEVLDDNAVFIGFDVVIANPPYIFARNSLDKGLTTEIKQYYKSNFKVAEYQLNLYPLFMELADNLLCLKGHFAFITPNNFLTLNTDSILRKQILSKSHIIITNFLSSVFEDAQVDTAVTIHSKYGNKNIISLYEYQDKHILIDTCNTDIFLNNHEYIINFDMLKNKETFTLLRKIENCSVTLCQIADVKAGLKAYEEGKGSPKQTNDMRKKRVYHANKKLNKNYIKYLQGKDVCRYYMGWSGEYLLFGDNLASPRKDPDLYNADRILVRQIPSKLPYCIQAVNTGEYLLNDLNSMNIVRIQESPLFVLAILNSKLMSYWFVNTFGKMQRRIFPQFKINELKRFPIVRNVSVKNKQKLVDLAQKCQLEKLQNPQADITTYESQIDKIIYKLYNLTNAEIKIIENIR